MENFDVSSYKARGAVGASDRNVRAQRASEKRHLSRMDEVSKRRRMALSPLADENAVEKCAIAGENEEQLSRRERLVIWKEERKRKKASEAQNKKKSFVVRHVKYEKQQFLPSTNSRKKVTKGVTQPVKPVQSAVNKPEKRVTRMSARNANQGLHLLADLKSNAAKKAQPKSACNDKLKEKAKVGPDKIVRVKQPSVKSKSSSSSGKDVGASQSNQKVKAEPKNQVKTRSHAKKLQEQPVSFDTSSTEDVKRGQLNAESEVEPQSFSPKDFQFTAPSGINTFTYLSKTFQFQPLSPYSAAEFIFPTSASSFCSPKKDKSADQKQEENTAWEDPVATCFMNNKLIENENVEQEKDDQEMEKCDGSESQKGSDKDAKIYTVTVEDEIPSSQQQSTAVEKAQSTEMDEQRDAAYFRNLVRMETDRLNENCHTWKEVDVDQCLSEEVLGQIRTTIGQAQLLIDQRFRQFSGLIDQSEDKNAEKQVTASDLQGFWEMIYFQVEDVDAKFDALEKLKENNWQQEEKKTKKFTKKPKVKKPKAGDDTKTNNKATASRKRIQEMRMAMAAEKEKMRSRKRDHQEEAFVTILTPVKKSKKKEGSDDVVLTPVRRSIRKTPQKRSMAANSTPVVVTTPKIISEDSPGLRLTPDNGNPPGDVNIVGTSMEIGELCEEGVSEMELREEESEMQCDLEQRKPEILKSACKTTENKSQKTPGKVTFQSPDIESTPECTVHEVDGNLMETAVNKAKRLTPRRSTPRKCGGRLGTPYYQQRPRRRVSTVGENVSHGTESEGRSSSESDADAPGSGFRRSFRKVPSKYRDSTQLEAASEQTGEGLEQDSFNKYLCPSSSDEENCTNKPVEFEHMAENVLNDKETKSEDFNLTPPDELRTFPKPSITKREQKPGRTPIHILRYLSEMDTPSPNPHQLTPVPKTTIYVPPSDSSKPLALGDSVGMMSLDNMVQRFPAKNEGSPLVSLAAMAGKEGQAALTPCSQLDSLCLKDSPANSEKRRDSVFFLPMSTTVVGAPDSLMSFSPVVEANESD